MFSEFGFEFGITDSEALRCLVETKKNDDNSRLAKDKEIQSDPVKKKLLLENGIDVDRSIKHLEERVGNYPQDEHVEDFFNLLEQAYQRLVSGFDDQGSDEGEFDQSVVKAKLADIISELKNFQSAIFGLSRLGTPRENRHFQAWMGILWNYIHHYDESNQRDKV